MLAAVHQTLSHWFRVISFTMIHWFWLKEHNCPKWLREHSVKLLFRKSCIVTRLYRFLSNQMYYPETSLTKVRQIWCGWAVWLNYSPHMVLSGFIKGTPCDHQLSWLWLFLLNACLFHSRGSNVRRPTINITHPNPRQKWAWPLELHLLKEKKKKKKSAFALNTQTVNQPRCQYQLKTPFQYTHFTDIRVLYRF